MGLYLTLAGRMGSGKTTLANELVSRHGFVTLAGSTVIADFHKTLDPPTAPSLGERIGYDETQKLMRAAWGMDAIAARIKQVLDGLGPDGHVCYDGVRNENDERRSRKDGGIIVALEADQMLRYQRRFAQSGGTLPLAQFRYDDERELEDPDPRGLHLRRVMDRADIRLNAERPVAEVIEELRAKLAALGKGF